MSGEPAPALPWQRACLDRLGTAAEVVAADAPDLDAVLAFDLAAARRVTAAPPHGIWTFVFGDPPQPGPPGRRESLSAARTMIARMVRLHGPAAATARVLREGVLKARRLTPGATEAILQGAVVPWPLQLALELAETGGLPADLGEVALPAAEPAAAGPPRPRLPLGAARSLLRRGWQAFGEEVWNVGIVLKPAAAFLTDPRPAPVEWLPELLPGGYHADPFGRRSADGGLRILVEGYTHAERQGFLALIERPAAGPPVARRLEIPIPGHLSYPYLIEEEGQVFCVPESHQAGRVVLLRADPWPERWVVERVLLDGFAGVDCTLFRHEGRWWMLGCDNRDEDQTKLHAFHSERLGGPWTPHAANPVKCDCRSSRPGGAPFLHEGRLYRPAPDCSSVYGGAVVLTRVDLLTPTRFQETPVARIAPDPT
ncbi:MAG TPA: hypothetical protein VFG43_09160, partial [Geminicoccaceae bacterium]|nr:hypothetical protein [Geminicoccaceae bacterium]